MLESSFTSLAVVRGAFVALGSAGPTDALMAASIAT